ncbi:hypothetical protein GGR57DRAFT_516275 [Xylariaceae sp. FL1272]|nr:hypothetical protein GGR57DRAFT_516275 [Xylariaceae sp. FL1272]
MSLYNSGRRRRTSAELRHEAERDDENDRLGVPATPMRHNANRLSVQSPTPQRSISRRQEVQNNINLDQLLFRVYSGEEFRDWPLTQFISERGQRSNIRVPSDFDYEAVRTDVNEFGIARDEPLVLARGRGLYTIKDERTFWIALTQVQKGVIPLITRYNLDCLPLMSQNDERTSILDVPDPESALVPPEHDEELFSNVDELIGSTPKRGPRGSKTPNAEGEEDVSDISVNENGVIKALENAGFNFNQDDDEEWQHVCDLFSCETTATEAKIDGIKVTIRGHQMLAIYRTLAQVTTGIASFIIGDDVGLGKTGTSLATLAIFHMFHRTRTEVMKEWEGKTRGARKHLKPDQTGKCPSQQGRVECWCNPKSLAREVTKVLPAFPSMVVIKPDLIDNWVKEFGKFIAADVRGSPTDDMSLAVAYATYDKKNDLTLNDRESLITPVVNPNAYGTEQGLTPPSNGSATIVYSSNSLMSKVRSINKINVAYRNDKKRNRTKAIPGLGFAFVFMEEFHDYHGSSGRTIPFALLRDLAELDPIRPTMAIGLSGSIKSDMRYWYPMIEHAFYNAELKDQALTFTNMDKLADFQQLLNHWNYLIMHLQEDVSMIEGRRGEEITTRSEQLIPFLKDFIPKMIIARNQGDRFRGGDPLYVKQDVTWVDLPMPDGETKQVFTQLSQRVKSWMEVRYASETEDAKKQGRMPLERRAWMNQQVRELPIQKGDHAHSEFQLCSKASCFPTIARIIENGEDEEVTYNDTLFSFKGLAVSISKALQKALNPSRAPPAQGEVLASLQKSVWFKHRKTLLTESPKMQRIVEELDGLLKLRGLSYDDPESVKTGLLPPPDVTNIRHLVIFADTNLTALLIFMILFLKHRKTKNISLLYCHSGVAPGERDAFCDYIQQDCTADSPNKVLISTIDTMGVGHNIYRASEAIIVDVPLSSDKQLQAFGRVDRPGNRQKPRIIQLFDSTNLSELVRMSRNHNREVLATIGYGDTVDFEKYLDQLKAADETPESVERGTAARPLSLSP